MLVFTIVLLILFINIALEFFFTCSLFLLLFFNFCYFLMLLFSIHLCWFFSYCVFSFALCFFITLVCLLFNFFIDMELRTKSIIFLFKTGDILEVLLKLDLQIIKKQASFNAEYETCYNVTHFSSKCIGPIPKEVDFDRFQNPAVSLERNMNDFLWVLLSWHSVPKQIIPSRTGFSIIIHDKMVLLKSSVSYLHCIYVPTTEITTIYQVY